MPRLPSVLRDNAPRLAVELGLNVVLPLLVYDLVAPRLGQVDGLIASSMPALLWSVLEFVRHRRIDALSALVLAGIALSLLAMLGGGSARLLQLRENLVGGLIGLVFLGSVLVRRPLIEQLARAGAARHSAERAAELAGLRDRPAFRRTMTRMTLVWGIGLCASAGLACLLLFVLTVPQYLLLSPLLGYGTMGALAGWTAWYARRRRRLAAS